MVTRPRTSGAPSDAGSTAVAPRGGRAAWDDWTEAAFGIRAGEGRRTALCFTYLFLGSAVFILGRTARDTLFLSRYPLSALPWMFVLFGLVSAVVAVAYGALADRFPRRLQIMGALAVGCVSYCAVWLLVRAKVSWIYPAFYIWTEVIANLLIMQFWTLANDLHDPRAAKRLFGAIGSARILGVVVCGLAVGMVVRLLGTAQLVLVLAGLLAVMGLVAHGLCRDPVASRPAPQKSAAGAPPSVLKNAYLRSLALVILLIFVALTVGDYQFKIIARQSYTEDALARFFSLFYAAAGAVGFLFQVFVTPRLLKARGVMTAMAVQPLCFAASSVGVLALGGLFPASLMKFSDNGLQYTVHETALQVLYVPFSASVKARARALLDTAVKPLSYGLGGLVLVVMVGDLSVRQLSLLTLPVALLWLALLPRVRRQYLGALEASLTGRAPAFPLDQEFVLDSESRAMLLKALLSSDAHLVLHAMERLTGEDSPELRAAYRGLARHGHPHVRERALLRIAALEDREGMEAAHAGLEDQDPKVWAAALHAVGRLERDDAVEHAQAALDHAKRPVRVAAAVALLRDGGIEGAVIGGTRLEALTVSPDPKRRAEAAEILQSLGSGGYKPLRRLLFDEDASVRRAALKAAASVADPRLVPLLVQSLGAPGSRHRAARALSAVGPPAVPVLAQSLAAGTTPRAAQLAIPRVLKAIPCPESYEALLALHGSPEDVVRLRVYAALGHLRESLRAAPLTLKAVQDRLEEEVRATYELAASWELARASYETPLLKDSVETDLRRGLRRILRVLELRYARPQLALVLRRLDDPARRANALETLDALLEPPLKPIVLPLLDDQPWARRLQQARERCPEPRLPARFLLDRCRDPNPYDAYAALCAAARHGEAAAFQPAKASVAHPDPLVREGVVAAAALGDPDSKAHLLATLAEDPDPVVSALARHALHPTEVAMYSTEEKILFLMSVPIFAKLPGEDLAPLARVSEVINFHAGDRIFKEGEMGDALYVVMRGEVAIEKGTRRLAALGPREAFGEMSVLDASERSADAVSLSESEVLKIDSEAFYDIMHEQVEIAEGVIRVLTQRLRDADERLQEASKGRPDVG